MAFLKMHAKQAKNRLFCATMAGPFSNESEFHQSISLLTPPQFYEKLYIRNKY